MFYNSAVCLLLCDLLGEVFFVPAQTTGGRIPGPSDLSGVSVFQCSPWLIMEVEVTIIQGLDLRQHSSGTARVLAWHIAQLIRT